MRDIKWYLEKRIILTTMAGDVSFEETIDNNRDLKAYLDEGTTPVHLIFDATEVKSSPTNIAQLRNTLDFLRHENLGWIISIGSNPLVNFASSVVTGLLKIKLRQASSFEEAVDTLKKLDNSLETVQ